MGHQADTIQAFVLPSQRPDVMSPIAEPEVEDALDNVQDTREVARRDAEGIIAEAEARAQALMEKARKQGYADGLEAGMEEMRARYSIAARTIESVSQRIVEQADELMRHTDVEIVKLAIAVAEKVMRREVDQNPQAVLPVVREAIVCAEGSRAVVLRVNPEDLGVVIAAQEDLLSVSVSLRQLDIVEDSRIQRGGCMIEMEVGSVDARIDNQIREIEQAFLKEHEHAL